MIEQQTINQVWPRMDQMDLLSGLYLAQSGRMVVVGEAVEPYGAKTRTRMFFLAEGNGMWKTEKKREWVHKNDVFFLLPGQEAQLVVERGGKAEVFWVDLYGDGVGPFLAQAGIDSSQLVVSGISNPRLSQQFPLLLHDTGHMTPVDHLRLLSNLYLVASLVLEAVPSQKWISVLPTEEAVMYTGQWKWWPSNDHIEEVYTAQPKAYAEFHFYGTGIRWYGTMNFDCGKADVIVDGRYQTTLDTYSPERLPHQLLYVNTKLTPGPHIIKIFCTGEKNSKATNCDVVIDRFCFYQPPFRSEREVLVERHSSRMVQQAKQWMEKEYQKPLQVEQMAKRLGVSRSYFSSRFQAEVGMSPSKYLTMVRMEQAKQLLQQTDEAMAQIALAVGYQDVFYFSKVFKKSEQLSPSEYRRMYQKEETV